MLPRPVPIQPHKTDWQTTFIAVLVVVVCGLHFHSITQRLKVNRAMLAVVHGVIYQDTALLQLSQRLLRSEIVDSSVRQQWITALISWRLGDESQAIDILTTPELVQDRFAQHLLGEILLEAGDTEGAIVAWERAGNSIHLFRLGKELSDHGWHSDAVLALNAALRAGYTDQVDAYYWIGLTYLRSGDATSALRAYTHCIEVNRLAYYCYLGAGQAAHRVGQDDLAVRLFLHAISLRPYEFGAFYRIGLLYLDQHKFENAQHNLALAVERDPTFGWGWYWLGEARRASGDMAGACQAYQRAGENGVTDATKLVNELCKKN